MRLQQTAQVTNFLSKIGYNIYHEGNLIYLNGLLFTVDPECEGLKMGTSLILFHLALIQLINRNYFSLSKNILFFIIIPFSIFLWYFTNIFRIILLTLSNTPSESFWHEGIGIFLFIAIVVFPIALSLLLNSEFHSQPSFSISKYSWKPFLIVFFLIIIYLFHPTEAQEMTERFPEKWNSLDLEEIDSSGNIASYSNGKYRVIFKRNLDFFRMSHHPRHCWTGSGYKFIYEKDYKLKTGENIKKAKIQKGEETLILYWWYELQKDNLQFRTGSELNWRIQSLKNLSRVQNINLVFPIAFESDLDLEEVGLFF